MEKQANDSFAQKVCDKAVRVQLTDGRELIGILLSVDKTGCLFLLDCLELIDISEKRAFVHDLFTPNLVELPVPGEGAPAYPENNSKRYHYMGNYTLLRKHVKRICLDLKA